MFGKIKIMKNNKRFLKLTISILFTIFLIGTALGQTLENNDKPLNVKMTKNELLSFDHKITSIYKYYDLDINLPAVYYQVSSVHTKGDLVTFYPTNMEFTEGLLKEMRNAKEGHKFYFDKITIIDKNGNAFQLKPIVITIMG